MPLSWRDFIFLPYVYETNLLTIQIIGNIFVGRHICDIIVVQRQ